MKTPANLALVYDTETSGLPLFSEPSEDPRQPHIVQLAAVLVDLDTRQTIESMNVIIKPNGWTIPDEVAKIHGITTDRALAEGIEEDTALDQLLGMWSFRPRIAHNEQFDARIIRIAQHRFDHSDEMLEAWKKGKAHCTQRLATPIMKLPPTPKMRAAGFFKHKSANLQEAHQHFCGEAFENAHSAMADVQACMAVYFAIQELQRAKEPAAA